MQTYGVLDRITPAEDDDRIEVGELLESSGVLLGASDATSGPNLLKATATCYVLW